MNSQLPVRPSRRVLLNSLLGAGSMTMLAGRAAAASRSADRIVVNLQLLGGFDGYGAVVPVSGGRFEAYRSARGPAALERGALLVPEGADFGFHPALAGLRALYEGGTLAVVANVGWQSPSQGHEDAALRYLPGGYLLPEWTRELDGGQEAPVATGFAESSALAVHQKGLAVGGRGTLIQRARSRELRTAFPETGLGQELRQIAALLAQGSGFGAGAQVFTATQSGWDLHQGSAARSLELLTELNDALVAFHEAVAGLGLLGSLVLYTDSEFSRALALNRQGGTDHGWGGPQLMMGGAIAGGRVYGEFASLQVGGAGDASGQGSFRPSTFRESYLGEIARWAGARTAYAGATPVGVLA